ncbi:MAG: NADPH-dependent 7-cyano-7-deazaguanine reductase QueF [Planctomycetaceae bacterium]|nr:MAG: NADPH-dependent 7-cyano-7-deazaguanine reductase QueF [Planctomycetaceae bacterium]
MPVPVDRGDGGNTIRPPNRSHHRNAMSDNFRATLETFENQFPNRDYLIETVCPEFTSVCPKTGQPDFGTLTLTYVPDRLCIELKSLKLYLQQFRNHGAFYEHVTNRIFDDLVAVSKPRSMKLTARFTPRGGLSTSITVEYTAPAGRQRSARPRRER